MSEPRNPSKLALVLTVAAAILAAGGTALLVLAPAALAQTPTSALPPDAWTWGLLSAALATGMSSLGAGYAVAKLGTAAVGALAEKPDLFGRLLIFVGLAEGIAIYGVIISILILNRLA
ncbi:MAG: ATP synthase subunit C [Burkholderiaceae bacterium]